jgi:tripartite-type tricarboxylate transporter receptor subunit TctC
MTQRRQFIQSTVACAAAAMAPAAFSQAAPWPAKPINYLVAFPPGGTTDILARVVSQKLGTALGTTLVIENKGGAGGSVGSEIAARAPADGYNLLGGTISSHAINVSLYPKLGYDPIKSFTPVYLYGTNPVVLVVAANSPYKTLRDLLTAAKANPGKLSGASAGNGTSQHLAQELLAFKGEVKFTHVPYKGSAPAIERAGRLHVRHHCGGGRPHPERQTACLGGDFWKALDRHLDRSAHRERIGLARNCRF